MSFMVQKSLLAMINTKLYRDICLKPSGDYVFGGHGIGNPFSKILRLSI